MNIKIDYVEKLTPVFVDPHRVNIIVGGRGSTKSTGVADYVNVGMMQGQLWCCAREQLNSIEESVHRTLLDEIDRLNLPGFESTTSAIRHESGGRCFYRGLARNITSLKSTLSGVDGLWIEEGEDLSANTLRVLTASVRLNAADTERAIAGEDVKMPIIIITMNRGSSEDPISDKFLKRAEAALAETGYYCDDMLQVVEVNYTDMPRDWFVMSGLEVERADDEKNLSPAMYRHKWHGAYLDTVDNAIILPEWFDACVDAHEKMNWKPTGAKIVSHDPSDEGEDDKATCLRHGSLIVDCFTDEDGDVSEGMDRATTYAINQEAQQFTWDGDGLGLSLKRQVGQNLSAHKNIQQVMFRGSEGVDRPEHIFEDVDYDVAKGVKNIDAFFNKRAQYYWMLAMRMRNTYLAIKKDQYIDPDDLLSISSEIKQLRKLKAELCRIPRKKNNNKKIQIMSKQEMFDRYKIKSPNMADCVMMSLAVNMQPKKPKTIKVNPTRNYW